MLKTLVLGSLVAGGVRGGTTLGNGRGPTRPRLTKGRLFARVP